MPNEIDTLDDAGITYRTICDGHYLIAGHYEYNAETGYWRDLFSLAIGYEIAVLIDHINLFETYHDDDFEMTEKPAPSRDSAPDPSSEPQLETEGAEFGAGHFFKDARLPEIWT